MCDGRICDGRVLSTFGVLGLIVCAPAATLVVDLNGTGQFTEIQTAIDAAADDDIVLVKPGEYVITQPIGFNRLHDPANPASPPVKNIIVNSEGGAEVTTIRMSETPAEEGRTSVVIFENGEGSASVLEGFALIGGRGTVHVDELFKGSCGGGVLCRNKSVAVIAECILSENYANYGGGILCWDCAPTLLNCTISHNQASECSGALHCYSASPTLANCVFDNNWSLWGAHVYCKADSSPALTRCRIEDVSSLCFGLTCAGNSCPTLTDCTLRVLSSDDSSPTLTRCMLRSISCNASPAAINDSRIEGGGVFCRESSSPTLTNCTVSSGAVSFQGGSPTLTNCTIVGGSGVATVGASPVLMNCTIVGNSRGVSMIGSMPTLCNCIVWGNAVSLPVYDGVSIPDVSYSCIDGADVVPGLGNINEHPLLN